MMLRGHAAFTEGTKTMTQRLLTHLRHVDIAAPDFDAQLGFYQSTWGLVGMADDGDIVFLAAEGSPEQYVVRLRRADDKRLDLVSFGAPDAAAVDQLARQLATAGVRLVSEPAGLQTPGGGYGFRFFDIDGRTVEVSADVKPRPHRKIQAGEPIPVKLSHVVLNSPDIDRTRAFYEAHLGFALSDTLMHPEAGNLMHFLRISPQHHSLALAAGPHTSLNHASFEMRGLEEYLRGTGRLLRAGATKLWGPGRHRIGNNTFSYFLDPQGNVMEYTTDLEMLDEDVWHPSLYDASEPATQDLWGTAGPFDEFVHTTMYNDADKGLFRAPPV